MTTDTGSVEWAPRRTHTLLIISCVDSARTIFACIVFDQEQELDCVASIYRG